MFNNFGDENIFFDNIANGVKRHWKTKSSYFIYSKGVEKSIISWIRFIKLYWSNFENNVYSINFQKMFNIFREEIILFQIIVIGVNL